MNLTDLFEKELKEQQLTIEIALQSTVILSDIHFGDEDTRALEIVLKFLKHRQPKYIMLLGDILDCYALSKFDKNPEKMLGIQKELDLLDTFFTKVREACPKADITYFLGNHEERLEKFLWKHPELYKLRSLGYEEFLKLKKHNIKLQTDYLEHWGIILTHGTKLGARAGMSASKELAKWKQNCISGHVHRLAFYTERSRDKTLWAIENGCLCNLNPEYTSMPDWSLGFSELVKYPDGKVVPLLYRIEDYQLRTDGYTFEA